MRKIMPVDLLLSQIINSSTKMHMKILKIQSILLVFFSTIQVLKV